MRKGNLVERCFLQQNRKEGSSLYLKVQCTPSKYNQLDQGNGSLLHFDLLIRNYSSHLSF